MQGCSETDPLRETLAGTRHRAPTSAASLKSITGARGSAGRGEAEEHLPARVHQDRLDGLEEAVALQRDGAVAAVRGPLPRHDQPQVQHRRAVPQLPCSVACRCGSSERAIGSPQAGTESARTMHDAGRHELLCSCARMRVQRAVSQTGAGLCASMCKRINDMHVTLRCPGRWRCVRGM